MAFSKIPLPLETLDQVAERRDKFIRASGDVDCKCGRPYFDHPHDMSPWQWLHVLCDGTRVKL